MALTAELLKQLDNEEEPLAKRFKLADEAFKSVDLSIQYREAVLLKWLLKLTDEGNVEAWMLFHDWLQSEQVIQVKLTDLTLDDVKMLSGVIEGCLRDSVTLDPKIKALALNSAMLLMENGVIRHYFKYDLKNYLKLVALILESVDEIELVLRFIKNKYLYYKSYLGAENFHKYFIELNLTTLINVAHKFQESEVVLQEVSAVLQRCIFQRNLQNFKDYFNTFFKENAGNVTHTLPKQIVKYLQKSYKLDFSLSFRLLLKSFCEAYHKEFSLVYMFLIVVHDLVGFNLNGHFKLFKSAKVHNVCNLFKSMKVLAEVLDVVVNTSNVVLDTVVCNVNFSDFIQNTVSSIISLSESSDRNILKIINHAVILNPLIAEQIVSKMLPYVMLSDNTGCPGEYGKLMLSVFQVFSKLNRLEEFISKMIVALKPKSVGKRIEEELFGFNGSIESKAPIREEQIQNILPDDVLDYFTQCVTTLASWQTISLFKLFQAHLESAVNGDLQNITKSPQCVTYIEILCTLTSQFLKSVRMAEHTVTNVEKFVDCMEGFKDILKKYGVALVAMEHNLTLMRMYLNMSYLWGELYIILCYYSINNEITFTKNLDSDYSACNITYLHSYLTTEQWCLISQRITNFGEKPCKQLMHKLFTQRLKSMQLFENNLNNEIISSYIKSFTESMEDCLEIVVQDSFVLNIVMPRMQSSDIINFADLLIKKFLDGSDALKQAKVLDNCTLVNALVYLLMLKINRVFKHKWKQDVPLPYSSTRVFGLVDESSCLFEELEGADAVTQNIISEFLRNIDLKNSEVTTGTKLNSNKIIVHLELLKSLPIVSLKSNTQIILFIYLTSVLNDVKLNLNPSNTLKEILESVLTGLLKNGLVTLECQALIKCVLQNFVNYTSPVRHIIERMFKTEDGLKTMRKLVEYLLENLQCEKHLYCAELILSGINKHKKTRVTLKMKDDVQECKALMTNELIKVVTSQDETCTNLLALYALLLKDCFTHDNADNLRTLTSVLDGYIEVAMNNAGVCNKNRIALFTTVLFGKNKVDSIKDEFSLDVWNACVKMRISDDDFEEYSKLIAMIFQQISNEEFSKMMKELLQISIKLLKAKDYGSFTKEINLWISILCCSFNATKINVCQEVFEALLHEIIKTARDAEAAEMFHKDITRLIVHLIKTFQFPLTATILDLMFLSVDLLINKPLKFTDSFSNCIQITEALLKYRGIYISDRLPSFLQQYRVLLIQLIAKSNEDLQLGEEDLKELSDCSHKLEKLTKQLLVHGKHLHRIAMYLIADVLNQFEAVAVHPSIKMHINNCVYDLISLCDQHAISFLMRALSTASTEMFKFIFNNYKKYYRFTGKV